MSTTRTTYVLYGAAARPYSASESKIMDIVKKSAESGGDMFIGIGHGLYATVVSNQLTGKSCAVIGHGTKPFYHGDLASTISVLTRPSSRHTGSIYYKTQREDG